MITSSDRVTRHAVIHSQLISEWVPPVELRSKISISCVMCACALSVDYLQEQKDAFFVKLQLIEWQRGMYWSLLVTSMPKVRRAHSGGMACLLRFPFKNTSRRASAMALQLLAFRVAMKSVLRNTFPDHKTYTSKACHQDQTRRQKCTPD